MREMGHLRKAWFCVEAGLAIYVLYSVVTDSFGGATNLAMAVFFGSQLVERAVLWWRGEDRDDGPPRLRLRGVPTKLPGSWRKNS
jgi:hypothetical protein